MTTTASFDSVWKMFQEMVIETREMRAQSERERQEMRERSEREMQEMRAQSEREMQEMRERSEREMQEMRERSERERIQRELAIQEMRAQNERMSQEAEQRSKEAEQRSKETEQRFKETERFLKDIGRQVGQLGSRWGEFVEGLIAPACETLFLERNIPVHQVSQRVKTKLPGNRHLELDLLVVNTEVIIPIEVKSRLRVEDVRDFIRRLGELKEFMPQYADRQVIGAVAGIVMDENVEQFAMNAGLFVIVQSGETVRLSNPLEFQPRIW